MKTLDIIKRAFIAGLTLGTIAVTGFSVAGPNDHTVVIRSAQTVEQVVSAELQSARFAEQIASYNGIASASTVLVIGTTLAIPRPYMQSIDFGRIVFVKGDVVHTQTDLVVNPPAKGSLIHNGDVFQTGEDGFVSLSFNSGARVNLQPESRVLINDIDCAKASVKCVISVSATKGQVHSEIAPRPEGQPPVRFSVETPFLTAAVRGTAFYVDLNDKENRIGVTKGLVATKSGDSNNDLPRGKGLLAQPGVVAEVVDLLAPPAMSIQSDSLLLSAEDSVSWTALDGAMNYQTTIASDRAMAEPLFARRTDQLSVSAALTPGDYFMTVAGVDNQDFIGLPARMKIRFAEITDPEQPRINIVRQGGTVELFIPGQQQPAQLLIGKSIDSDVFETRILDNASEKLTLNLDENQDWVFRARRVLGDYEVSAYSDYYVLSAVAK